MRKKTELETKLKEAEKALETANGIEADRLAAVVITLRWALNKPITQPPKDPV